MGDGARPCPGPGPNGNDAPLGDGRPRGDAPPVPGPRGTAAGSPPIVPTVADGRLLGSKPIGICPMEDGCGTGDEPGSLSWYPLRWPLGPKRPDAVEPAPRPAPGDEVAARGSGASAGRFPAACRSASPALVKAVDSDGLRVSVGVVICLWKVLIRLSSAPP